MKIESIFKLKTKNRVLSTVVGVLIGSGICSLFVLMAIYPYRPDNIFSWIVLFLLSMPAVILLELLGATFLQNKFTSRVNRPARIFIGVVSVIIICILLLVVWEWIKPLLGTWK